MSGLSPEALLSEALADGVFSAAALQASRGTENISAAVGGASAGSMFDLASLTKVLYTAAGAMALAAEGTLDLDGPVRDVLPEWSGGEGVRFAQLLSHEAGLVWWLPLYEQIGADGGLPRTLGQREAVRGACARLGLERTPGAEAVYSDPTYILLEWALERLAGGDLLSLVQERVWAPMGVADLAFVDLHAEGEPTRLREAGDWVPTAHCPWRGRRLHGEVHDHNAHAMGGRAGHAGLFGNAGAVHRFGAGLLGCLEGGGPLPAEVVRHFFACRGQAPGSTRVLGWDTPTPGASTAGRYISSSAVGHLGFTGTSLWLDPRTGLVCALLTNRLFFNEDPAGMRRLRPRVHDAVHEGLGLCP